MTTIGSESVHPAGQGVIDTLKAKGYYDRSFDLVVSIRVQEGKENELLEKLRLAGRESRKEKGCIQYDVSRDLQESVFVIYEKWENGAILENHFRLSHTKELLDKINEVGSEKIMHITSLIESSSSLCLILYFIHFNNLTETLHSRKFFDENLRTHKNQDELNVFHLDNEKN